jgi:acetamidase/formamidase
LAIHHLSAESVHYRFDNSLEPGLTVESGDTVVIECRDGTDGQLTRDTGVEALETVDWDRIHALTGPVYVEGAKPGDVLRVEILDFEHPGWGWTGIWPGFGLLPDDFGDLHEYRIWEAGPDGRTELEPGIRVPIEPFMGIMSVAPAEPGVHQSMPPRSWGGNLDIRHMTKGSVGLFPVHVPGALFSTGDGHLAQGDGEVCGTAIEAPMTVTVRLSVLKGRSIKSVECDTRTPTTARAEGMGYHVTTGAGDDLHENAQNAVRRMIDWLEAEHGLTRPAAYMLCSAAGDLKIAVPKMGGEHSALVTFHLPHSVFVA